MHLIVGKYKNGHIILKKKPKTNGELKVAVLFPESSRKGKGFTKKQVQKLIGVVSLGGNALDDTERLYS